MRVSRLYCSELTATATTLVLPEAAHRHAVQVLRLKAQAEIHLFNGKGLERSAVLTEVSKRTSTVTLGQLIKCETESPLKVTLLQSISRGERMDYALQKAVELGVDEIIPVISERCNVQLSQGRGEKRSLHWQGVIISACEQSGRAVIPELKPIIPLEEALLLTEASCRLVLDPQASQGLTSLVKAEDVQLLIGPEGGLSEQELTQVSKAGFTAVNFGPRILRTETATASALAAVQLLWGDLG